MARPAPRRLCLAGGDRLDCGTGSDHLYRGLLSSDVFVNRSDYGADPVHGFEDYSGWLALITNARDKIKVDVSGIASFGALGMRGVQMGSDVHFDFGGGDRLVIKSASLANLAAHDFIFV